MIRTWAATGILLAISSTAPGQVISPDRIELDTTGNGIFEPGESVDVRPYWRSNAAVGLSGGPGDFSNFTGPAGATHTIVDGAATYLGWPAGSPPVSCAVQDCYALSVAAATRPIQHWDASVLEGIWSGGVTNTWTIHIGATFTDVPPSSGFYRFVETIVHKDVTGGCSATAYCPTAATTRDAMAVFVLVSKEAPGYVPPACGATPMFPGVPVTNGFCPWIEELFRRGVVTGCGGGNYCPTAAVTREQMSVFLTVTFGLTIYGV